MWLLNIRLNIGLNIKATVCLVETMLTESHKILKPILNEGKK